MPARGHAFPGGSVSFERANETRTVLFPWSPGSVTGSSSRLLARNELAAAISVTSSIDFAPSKASGNGLAVFRWFRKLAWRASTSWIAAAVFEHAVVLDGRCRARVGGDAGIFEGLADRQELARGLVPEVVLGFGDRVTTLLAGRCR